MIKDDKVPAVNLLLWIQIKCLSLNKIDIKFIYNDSYSNLQ